MFRRYIAGAGRISRVDAGDAFAEDIINVINLPDITLGAKCLWIICVIFEKVCNNLVCSPLKGNLRRGTIYYGSSSWLMVNDFGFDIEDLHLNISEYF